MRWKIWNNSYSRRTDEEQKVASWKDERKEKSDLANKQKKRGTTRENRKGKRRKKKQTGVRTWFEEKKKSRSGVDEGLGMCSEDCREYAISVFAESEKVEPGSLWSWFLEEVLTNLVEVKEKSGEEPGHRTYFFSSNLIEWYRVTLIDAQRGKDWVRFRRGKPSGVEWNTRNRPLEERGETKIQQPSLIVG